MSQRGVPPLVAITSLQVIALPLPLTVATRRQMGVRQSKYLAGAVCGSKCHFMLLCSVYARFEYTRVLIKPRLATALRSYHSLVDLSGYLANWPD